MKEVNLIRRLQAGNRFALSQAMDTYTVFSAYMFFPAGKTVITLPYMIPIAASVLIIAALPLAHRGFCKHQVV